jgi:hypothetical protein
MKDLQVGEYMVKEKESTVTHKYGVFLRMELSAKGRHVKRKTAYWYSATDTLLQIHGYEDEPPTFQWSEEDHCFIGLGKYEDFAGCTPLTIFNKLMTGKPCECFLCRGSEHFSACGDKKQ